MPLACRATLGEISDALAVALTVIWCRPVCYRVIARSYHQSEKSASEFDAIVAQTEQFLADLVVAAHSDR
ncbi:hypothetical protein ACNKHP_09205 [Shigella boydii]